MLMVLLISSVLQSGHSTVSLKRAAPSPAVRAPPPPSHPTTTTHHIMDGFYDQQVPFMVPPSVSGHTAAPHI